MARVAALLCLFALSCSILASKGPLVAFTARFYNPPGDKRIAHHEVYVCDLLGHGRRRVSSGKFDCNWVRWAGHDKLAWVEFVPGIYDHLGFRGAEYKPQRLVVYDLKTRSRRIVYTGKVEPLTWKNGYTTSGLWRRGEATYKCGAKTVSLGWKSLAWPPKHKGPGILADGAKYKQAWFDGRAWIYDLGEVGRKPGDERNDGPGYSGPGSVIARHGRRVRVQMPDPHLFSSANNLRFSYFLSCFYSGSAGQFEGINEVDWSTGKVRELDGTIDTDFDGRERYFAGRGWNKGLGDLGKDHGVWVTDITVGERRTDKTWEIFDGLVSASSVAIQPESARHR